MRINKSFLKSAVALLCLLVGQAVAAGKPNVLLILVDDVGYCDVGAFASQLRGVPTDKLYYETPRMDAFKFARNDDGLSKFDPSAADGINSKGLN